MGYTLHGTNTRNGYMTVTTDLFLSYCVPTSLRS
jgi:hypothetical protein